ncbi:hypothetical protein JJC03_10170 [Flavobacterium oreochromis]|uniref:hypothetical protein n=1 Tax=Flavobacterium oreochromis TaxID=2906078 RepID=UPI001CE4FC5F|nr:hypothetical protein [Flavobacterium oreochromis]QYS85576.1 hypothetical protein JJC03_10170 [Flavobacterium oreochromis]
MKKTIAFLFFTFLVSCINKADHQSFEVKKEVDVNKNRSTNKKVLEYQNDEYLDKLGSGLLRINNINNLQEIVFFLDSNCTKPIDKKILIGTDIIPFLYKTDYGILFLNCLEEDKNNYQIYAKQSQVVYLPKSDKVIYFDWEYFIKDEVLGIEFKKNIPTYYSNSINGKSLDIKPSSDDEIEVLQINDEWILINNLTMKMKYWIKWRDSNKILVYFNLLV